MKVQIARSPDSRRHILRIGEKNLSFFELNSYVAKGRITRWSEKFLALRNDGDSLCLPFDSYSSDGIPVEVYLGATKKQENIALYWGKSTDGCWGFGWGKMARNHIDTDILCCCQYSKHGFCPFCEDDIDSLIDTAFLGEYNIQELINAILNAEIIPILD